MKFTTQLELNITIKDQNAIYSTDYDQMLLAHAKILYEKKCRDGQYIQSVDKLVRRSLPNLIRRDLTSKIRVYIEVEVTAIRYDKMDFIDGLQIHKVIARTNDDGYNVIYCGNDHVICVIKASNDVSQFKIGDIIPARVAQSMYTIGSKYIKMSGYQFLPNIPDPVSYSIGTLHPDVKNLFKTMILPLLEKELEKKDSLDSARWDHFAKLLIPTKKPTKVSSSDVSIMDIDALQRKIITIDYKSDLSKLKISAISSPSTGDIVVADDQKNIIIRTAYEFVKYIAMINNLTETYATDDEYANIEYIWKRYEENKA